MQAVSNLLPRLDVDLKKGDCGRLAVFGGSEDYPGAPFYAATSMLRLGADLAHIFTEPAAAAVIKTYSPEVLVGKSPAFLNWLHALDGVLIGPGAGRDGAAVDLLSAAIRAATAAEPPQPIVIDADGLWAIYQSWIDGDRFPEQSIVILTPNVNEMDRLARKFLNDTTKGRPVEEVSRLATALAELLHCHVFVKGPVDLFVTPKKAVTAFSHPGSPRRPGGIGDCLAGMMATFLVWAHKLSQPIEMAAEAASYVTREACREAYANQGRGMNATDIIAKIVPLIRHVEGTPSNRMSPVSIVSSLSNLLLGKLKKTPSPSPSLIFSTKQALHLLAVMANKWLEKPPGEMSPLIFEEAAASFPTQLNATRVAYILSSARVAAIHLRPSVMKTERDGKSLATLIALISSKYCDRCTKSVVYIDSGIAYEIPDNVHISHFTAINEEAHLNTNILFVDRQTAMKAAIFLKAKIFFIVKKGSCFNQRLGQLMTCLAKGLKKGRIERVVILSDEASSDQDIQSTKDAFNGLEIIFESVGFD